METNYDIAVDVCKFSEKLEGCLQIFFMGVIDEGLDYPGAHRFFQIKF